MILETLRRIIIPTVILAIIGFFSGIALFVTPVALIEFPAWVIGLTLFLLIFHLDDIRRISAFAGLIRVTSVLAIAAFVVGDVWFLANSGVAAVAWLPVWPYCALGGTLTGSLLGLIEGIWRGSVWQRYMRFVAFMQRKQFWWTSV